MVVRGGCFQWRGRKRERVGFEGPLGPRQLFVGVIHILAGESGVGGLGVLLKPTHVPENPMSGSFRYLRKQTQSYRSEKDFKDWPKFRNRRSRRRRVCWWHCHLLK